MQITAQEIGNILKEKIANYSNTEELAETGVVLSVGDGICKVYGLRNVAMGELVEF